MNSTKLAVILTLGLILASLLIFAKRPPDSPAPFITDAEREHYAQIKKQVLDKNPELQSKDISLRSEAESLEKQYRQAASSFDEARRNFEDNNRKIFDEMYKIDPTTEGVYFRMGSEFSLPSHGPPKDGERELKMFDSQSFIFRFDWSSTAKVGALLTMLLGLFLLYRPPSLAGANLYLLLAVLPAILAGPMAVSYADRSIFAQESGIYDGPTWPQLFLQHHQAFLTNYLYCLPALLLYAVLVLRIRFLGRKDFK